MVHRGTVDLTASPWHPSPFPEAFDPGEAELSLSVPLVVVLTVESPRSADEDRRTRDDSGLHSGTGRFLMHDIMLNRGFQLV